MKIEKYIIILILLVTNIYGNKLIEINLNKQKIYAIEDGNILFSGSISSGKKGHRTPRGTFKVLDKERFHISNKYPEPNGGAKMPYMLRLTHYGLAIHQGYLPGYPASHGCIRVSKSTAKKLWYWANRGVKVKIYGNASRFKYLKRKSKKRLTKRRVKKKHFTKRVYKKRKKVYAKNYKPKGEYEVIEVYDSW